MVGLLMEIVLEHDEIQALLREALAARGIEVPRKADFRVRSNHKKGTIRVVFKSEEERRD
jgi:hypothetical protein